MKTNENMFIITTGTVVDEVMRMAEKTEIQTGHSIYENYMNHIFNIIIQADYPDSAIHIPIETYDKYSVLLNWLELGEIVKLSKGHYSPVYYIELHDNDKFEKALDMIMERINEEIGK